MLTITLRDLQWRARRFALGVVATALVFTTTLLLVGVHASFTDETASTVAAIAIKPVFPIVVHLSVATCGLLVGLALLVGLLVSLVSIRQCASVDPAMAFGRH